jgi:hypothetical protein
MVKKLALVSENAASTPATEKDDRVLVNFYANAELLAKIDDYRWSNRIEGRAETVRQLVVKAIS